jgi:SAM-dependent methyltransferase
LSAHPGALAFDHAVDVYEEARPPYPADTLAWLARRLELRPGRTVLDLGAGTGKLTRGLVGFGARVLAVEPLPAMRARLAELVPQAEVLAGAAEAIPLPDASVDAVTVGQAFHWFRLADALPELHRVLRPAGALALVWNLREGPLDDVLTRVLRPLRGETPAQADRRWREGLEASALFGPLEEREFRWSEEVEPELLVKRALSISFVAALPPERQEEVAASVREALAPFGRPLRAQLVTKAFISLRQTASR